ncbi:MAG: helix-turn-helix transcriptional regulator [Lentisphaeria bacterium]|nr:helix-turn-helix transcriptional regulator [Lentisphaeria bacterium]
MFVFEDVDLRAVHHFFSASSIRNTCTMRLNSIEFLKSGSLEFLIDGKAVELHAPVIFWMKRGHTYSFREVPECKAADCEHIFVDCSGFISERIIQLLEEKCPSMSLSPAEPKRICSTMADMCRYYCQDKIKYYPELVSCYIRLVLLLEDELKQQKKGGRDSYNIKHLADEMCREPFREYDFKKLASSAGVSSAHFCRLFRQMHHITPLEFLRVRRVLAAAEAVKKNKLRIKEIAEQCGYSSLIEFSRSFKRYFGVSPREFRNREDNI